MKYDAFISYKRQSGSVWASLVRAILKQKFIPYMDVHKKKGTNDWWAGLKKDIMDSYCVIMVLTKDLEDSLHDDKDFYLEELEFAKENGKIIIPFFPNDCCINDFHDKRLTDILHLCESSLQYKVDDPDITYGNMFSFINSHLELKLSSDEDCIYELTKGRKYDNEYGEIKKGESKVIYIPRHFVGLLKIDIISKDRNDNTVYNYLVNDDDTSIMDDHTKYWNTHEDLQKVIDIKWIFERKKKHEKERLSGMPKPSEAIGNMFDNLKVLGI